MCVFRFLAYVCRVVVFLPICCVVCFGVRVPAFTPGFTQIMPEGKEKDDKEKNAVTDAQQIVKLFLDQAQGSGLVRDGDEFAKALVVDVKEQVTQVCCCLFSVCVSFLFVCFSVPSLLVCVHVCLLFVRIGVLSS